MDITSYIIDLFDYPYQDVREFWLQYPSVTPAYNYDLSSWHSNYARSVEMFVPTDSKVETLFNLRFPRAHRGSTTNRIST